MFGRRNRIIKRHRRFSNLLFRYTQSKIDTAMIIPYGIYSVHRVSLKESNWFGATQRDVPALK